MRRLLLTTVAVLALAAPALADNIIATVKVDNVVVDISTSAGSSLNIVDQSFGPVFNNNTISVGTQAGLAAPGILTTNTFNVNQTIGGVHDLVIDIVGLGLTGTGLLTSLLNTFSVSGLPANWTIQEQTFINNVLQADTGVFTGVSDSASAITAAVLTMPFNAEAIYTIHSTGIGNLNGGIDISAAAVPLPAAVWLFGSGLGVLGLVGRRRRKQSAVVA